MSNTIKEEILNAAKHIYNIDLGNKTYSSEEILDILRETIKKDNTNMSEPSSGGLMGWICPVCGRGLSPYTSSCPCAINREITCGTGTATPCQNGWRLCKGE